MSDKGDSGTKEAGSTPAVDEQTVEKLVQEVVNATDTCPPVPTSPGLTASGKKKRLCRYPGCTRVIKSQGHCQRHGARAKRCKVEGCEKQAQGTHEGMCKRHWKAVHCPAPPPKPEEVPPPPEGESVYDSILPLSTSFRPLSNSVLRAIKKVEDNKKQQDNAEESSSNQDAAKADDDEDGEAPTSAPTMMPLVKHLKDGSSKPAGWHRNEERRARGSFPVAALSSQLEPWERQLALFEIFLLSGGIPKVNFSDLAHAWGREKGFHQLLVQSVCDRRGEVERKKRSDAGKIMSPAERQAFRQKLKKARLSNNKEEADEQEASSSKENKDAMDTTTEELKPASVEEMVEQVSV